LDPQGVHVIAFIFVYSPTKLRVDGAEPIKAFAPAVSYNAAQPVVGAGEEKVLDRGIYGTCSEPDVEPEFSVVGGTIAIDYDLAIYREKDPFPTIVTIDPALTAPELAARSSRVCAAFPTLQDEDLRSYLIAKPVPVP
jgi:hypothetical protein